jgi:hypothetical protein
LPPSKVLPVGCPGAREIQAEVVGRRYDWIARK